MIITNTRKLRIRHTIHPHEVAIAELTAKYTSGSGRFYSTKEMTAILLKAGIEPVREIKNDDVKDSVCRVYDRAMIDAFFASTLGKRVYSDSEFRYRDMETIAVPESVKPTKQPETKAVAVNQEPNAEDILVLDSAFRSMFISQTGATYRANRWRDLGLPTYQVLTPTGVQVMMKRSDILKFMIGHTRGDSIDRDNAIFIAHFANDLGLSGKAKIEYEKLVNRLKAIHEKLGPNLVKSTISRLS